MPELGTKYECYSCGTKFYDLGKPQPLCPKCGANQKDAAAVKPTHETASHRRKRKEEPVRDAEGDGEEQEFARGGGDEDGGGHEEDPHDHAEEVEADDDHDHE